MTFIKVSFATHILPMAFVLVAALPHPAVAQNDLHMGTWKQNFEKSKCDPPPSGPTPQSVIRTYEPFEGKGVKATFVTISADGRETKTSYSAHFDGKDYPYEGAPGPATVSLKRIDAYSWLATNNGPGKTTNTGTNTVSKDGKTLTYTSKGTNPRGMPISCVQVFDRQ